MELEERPNCPLSALWIPKVEVSSRKSLPLSRTTLSDPKPKESLQSQCNALRFAIVVERKLKLLFNGVEAVR